MKVSELEIELRLEYEPSTHLGLAFNLWAESLNWQSFGQNLRVSNEQQNDRLQKIDLSSCSLIKILTSEKLTNESLSTLILYIDQIKFYWTPNPDNFNLAEFYLGEGGFDAVSPFYAVLFPTGSVFSFDRMNNRTDFYQIGSCKFSFEFNFTAVNNRKDSKEVTIVKEPKIQFIFPDSIGEKEILHYSQLVTLVTSFFFHRPIEIILSRIHLDQHTITIKKIPENKKYPKIYGTREFGLPRMFHNFLKENWQEGAMKNFRKLIEVINLFNQSFQLDHYSQFLVRYGIIEICNTEKDKGELFNFTLSKKDQNKKFREALEVILTAIPEEDQKAFQEKWTSIQGKMKYRPMKSPLISFLEKVGFDTKDFPISINELKALRDKITHGSILKIDKEQLRKANIQLYRINGILILHLLDIKKWKFNNKIN
ncbi:hypothetical protein [uncultured Roseivirga sp.]|uniref:hypothetical protein n=1 Tax=uncultured Roseivirga sp. TaxID=543088 RepID=UPI002587DC5A|nr:hypothetical protein [uncultured Roseivirga sp.]